MHSGQLAGGGDRHNKELLGSNKVIKKMHQFSMSNEHNSTTYVSKQNCKERTADPLVETSAPLHQKQIDPKAANQEGPS